ncbi:hypothetical protein UWK_01979 [Desulfocapsa sulfexigens DSM 10523]|uniref:Glycosyltransferase RgtA/B/C/D-like domain-containing protein n=1 Tax=Desulfocapsa sulfexigens (strain DSM 10523 / SB164P1) TaxID=1167006 RepID=M1NFV8_DESSD|nr:hypothetical protein [Desulfocapsa sulfexigens]AGF78529.1 hypothetical protein UWK_01979 [Desulfocapsa sulfexigens DSM 10523]
MMPNKNNCCFRVLYFFTLFVLSTGFGLYLWNKILLPFHNPDNIIGPLSLAGLNPNNDILRFALFMAFPPVLVFISSFLIRKENTFRTRSSLTKRQQTKHLPWFIVITSLLLSLATPTYHASGTFDTFHEGETLGAAMSLQEGKVPYRDVLFSHGVFHDPLRSIIAMELFGKSIGATRALTSLIKVLSFVCLGLLILRLFNNNGTWALLTFFIMFLVIPKETFIVLPRDLISFSYLILLTAVPGLPPKRYSYLTISILSFLLAYMPIVSFGITIDRAFYITALYILLCPVLFLGFFRKTPWRSLFVRYSFLGVLVGMLSLTILLQGAVSDFVQFVFVHIPKTKEFADGLLFPVFTPRYLTILLLLSSICYWLATRLLCTLVTKKQYVLHFLVFWRKYFNAIVLFLVAVFCFRNALGRSDDEHLAYSSLFPILAFLYIAIHYYIDRHINALWYKRITLLIILTAGLYSISTLINISSIKSITDNFPIYTKDSEFIPPEYKSTISFLTTNLTGDEKFITLTNEASWYYFIDQACPTRFPLVWFALSQKNQKIFIESIGRQNIRFILYRNRHWANNIDEITNEERLPLLFNYVSENYHPLVNIDGNEIWERNITAQ